jgi:hypothetical protein
MTDFLDIHIKLEVGGTGVFVLAVVWLFVLWRVYLARSRGRARPRPSGPGDRALPESASLPQIPSAPATAHLRPLHFQPHELTLRRSDEDDVGDVA